MYHMAQSAPKERAPRGIDPFWERPKPEPSLRWDRWRILLKLAYLAIKSISIDILQDEPTDNVTFPLELIYEDDVDNSTAQSERGRKIRNEQLKNA